MVVLTPTPAAHAAGGRALVDQKHRYARKANRPTITGRTRTSGAEVAPKIGQRVGTQRFAKPVGHPSLGDAAEVDPLSRLESGSAPLDLEHVGQRRHRMQV